ncbi:MAG: hypothetical protein NTW06_02535, partial [Candidatus Falkowbacteria bacterium]|nr:hypothetical protein [Candidatus Falkowbacteria bacterium]
KYKRINTFSVPYNYENGTIEMWIKINQDNSGSKMAINNVSLFSAYDIKNKSNRLIFDIQGNLFKLELMQYDNKINQFATGGTWFAHYDNLEPIKTNEWYYTVVTWQKGVQPKFYLNGVLASEDAFGPVFPELVNNDLLKEIVVGHDYFAGDSKNLNIDQIRLSSVARTDQEITDNYNNGLGNGFSFDEGTILLSNFENNLNYQTRNSSQGVFTYQDNTPIFPGNYNKPSSVGIELYIFTPDKEQTLPGFQTAYAAWTDKKTIQNLALDDNGKPWLEVKKDKYYLCRFIL